VWNHQILILFPNATETRPQDLRLSIYNDLEAIRLLWNRMAHTSPIFTRNLADDLLKILDLTSGRARPRPGSELWRGVTGILPDKPLTSPARRVWILSGNRSVG
jgi:hypothetical protein